MALSKFIKFENGSVRYRWSEVDAWFADQEAHATWRECCMICARKNKKAPAVNPVVRATSGEGSRTNPTQEEIQMSHDNACDIDNAPEELSEYERMELDFATLAADRGLIPESALWKLRTSRLLLQRD